jgi:hypothetical protein
MNIFYLSHNTTECAKLHVDKHCVKMIVECVFKNDKYTY